MGANIVDMTGLKQTMSTKIMQNRLTGAKTGNPQLCTEDSKLLKRFYTTKNRSGPWLS